MKIKAALFDFDGVLVDTERLYDIFWADMGKRHHIPDPNFSKAIKGSTLESSINTLRIVAKKRNAKSWTNRTVMM